MIAFGPVPSRRLGRSLGINNIPSKFCSYSCVYCQLGRTLGMDVVRREFYAPDRILKKVRRQIENAYTGGESIDYLTFVPDGEPTLDVNLGREIELLRPLGIKIAVITNASLFGRKDVQADLMQADWVSLKVDSVRQNCWRKMNRPHRALRLNSLLAGMLEFGRKFKGELVTETMLVKGVNGHASPLKEIAAFIGRLEPARAYVAIPTRPPSEKWVKPPGEDIINLAFQIFKEKIDSVEYIIGYEGNDFALTGNVVDDLLNITAVHPMREDAVNEFLMRAEADWMLVHRLIAQARMIEAGFAGWKFYLRRLPESPGS
ncbi:MAG: radical SAM protein [Desulfobacterales bacterium]|nr:MAG: radical SAM protein [Desulfobacterales bacterium]